MDLLSNKRSNILLGIGGLVGAAFGLGYWAVSPVDAHLQPGWPPIALESPPPIVQSIVAVTVSSPGAAYADKKQLSRQAEYWVTKFESSEFTDFLAARLTRANPEYEYSPDDLRQIMQTRFDGSSPAFQIKIRSTRGDEAAFLASAVPVIFKEYLATEEGGILLQDYEDAQARFDAIQTDLDKARSEVETLTSRNQTDPALYLAYTLATAKVDGLTGQLRALYSEMALLIAKGSSEADYLDSYGKIERVTASLAQARQESTEIKAQIDAAGKYPSPPLVLASARVDALSKELSSLASTLASYGIRVSKQSQALRMFTAEEPLPPEVVPPEKVRRRDVMVSGMGVGLGLVWAGLNLKRWLTPSSKNAARRRSEVVDTDDDDEKDNVA